MCSFFPCAELLGHMLLLVKGNPLYKSTTLSAIDSESVSWHKPGGNDYSFLSFRENSQH